MKVNGRDFTPRFKEITPKKEKKPLSKVHKKTGEADLFRSIIQERSIGGKTYSQVSGELIDSPNHTNCAHLLSKKKYPEFRLRKDNIAILSFDEHYQLDCGLVSELKMNPKWKWLFDKIEELKGEYANLEKSAA